MLSISMIFNCLIHVDIVCLRVFRIGRVGGLVALFSGRTLRHRSVAVMSLFGFSGHLDGEFDDYDQGAYPAYPRDKRQDNGQ